jgi:hypothetical protein
MAIQIQGACGDIIEVDGTTYRTVKVTLRPVDYGTLGQYRISMQSGTIAAGMAAFAPIFQARWTDTPEIALVWGLSIDGLSGGTAAFTAGIGYIGMQIVRAWTVDGSGGTPATLTGNNQALRSSMSPSLFGAHGTGAIRIANTAALSAGTATTDTQGVGQVYFAVGTAASVNYLSQYCMYGSSAMEEGGNPAPIVLFQNEGVNLVASVPATGTWKFGVSLDWSEVRSY